jgi:cytochrome c oxidase subunit 1
MFGRMMNPTLGKLHFWFSFIPINLIFCSMLYVGFGGMQRRLYDPSVYETFKHLLPANQFISYSAFVLAFGSIFFIINFFYSLIAGAKAEANPWQVTTLEWTNTTSPPPHHNYDVIPVVLRGPHEFGNPETLKLLGKDWLGQAEPLPGSAGAKSSE